MFKFKIEKPLPKIKGSLRDPFFYLGIIAIIFFGLISFFSNPFLRAGGKTEKKFFLASLLEVSARTSNQNLFIDSTKKSWPESPEFILVEGNTLRAASPLVNFTPQVLGIWLGEAESEPNREITEYVVKEGDSLSSIAEKFKISLNTILWANNLNQNSIIRPGQKLIILPVSGVIHRVKEGDTLSEIAKKYQGKVEEIISFNELSSEGDIYVGDIIIIPNGTMPTPKITSSPKLVPLRSSYFICPVAGGCRITQGLHWYNAIDFSNGKCGEPILAAAGGKVLKVKLTNSTSPWAFGGAGNHLTILHPNGVVTSYNHLLTIFVSPGQEVSQGQIIALMGGQPGTPGAGRSTGCHLHFGVSGAQNPFAK